MPPRPTGPTLEKRFWITSQKCSPTFYVMEFWTPYILLWPGVTPFHQVVQSDTALDENTGSLRELRPSNVHHMGLYQSNTENTEKQQGIRNKITHNYHKMLRLHCAGHLLLIFLMDYKPSKWPANYSWGSQSAMHTMTLEREWYFLWTVFKGFRCCQHLCIHCQWLWK